MVRLLYLLGVTVLVAGYGAQLTGTSSLISEKSESHAHHKSCTCDLETGECTCDLMKHKHHEQKQSKKRKTYIHHCSSPNTVAIPAFEIPKFLIEEGFELPNKHGFQYHQHSPSILDDQLHTRSLLRPPQAA